MDTNEEPEIIDLATMTDTPILNIRDRLLSVKLTEAQWVEFVELQVAAIIDMTALEVTEKARSAVWRGQHKARESEVQRLVGIVDARAEDRQVKVIDYALLESNELVTVRADTGEVRNRRALKASEIDKLSQQTLPLPGAEGDELPPEAEAKPLPKGARDLATVIAAGEADHALDALEADNRPTVEKALVARREVLTALAFAEAEADAPEPKKNL